VLLAGLTAFRDPRAPALAIALLIWGALACSITMLVSSRGHAQTVNRTVVPAPVPSPTPTNNVAETKRLTSLVQKALQNMNNSSALAKCQLIPELPRTLAAIRGSWSTDRHHEPTPLEDAQALREALGTAIEHLKPSREYEILHHEYELGMQTSAIMNRLAISEATFHHWRRSAIEAVAGELRMQEGALAAAPPEVDRSTAAPHEA
jgi:hypothetical protein